MRREHRWGPTLTDIADGGVYPGSCSDSECERDIDGKEWFWFVDGGSFKLTFCQAHEPNGDVWEYVTQATAVSLIDDRTAEEFDRVIDIGAFFN